MCPTGALTEKSILNKQVPLDESYTTEKVIINGREAEVTVASYDGKILRVIPNDEVSRNSGLSREQLLDLIK